MWHYIDVLLAVFHAIAQEIRPFVQQLVQANNEENIIWTQLPIVDSDRLDQLSLGSPIHMD